MYKCYGCFTTQYWNFHSVPIIPNWIERDIYMVRREYKCIHIHCTQSYDFLLRSIENSIRAHYTPQNRERHPYRYEMWHFWLLHIDLWNIHSDTVNSEHTYYCIGVEFQNSVGIQIYCLSLPVQHLPITNTKIKIESFTT